MYECVLLEFVVSVDSDFGVFLWIWFPLVNSIWCFNLRSKSYEIYYDQESSDGNVSSDRDGPIVP